MLLGSEVMLGREDFLVLPGSEVMLETEVLTVLCEVMLGEGFLLLPRNLTSWSVHGQVTKVP